MADIVRVLQTGGAAANVGVNNVASSVGGIGGQIIGGMGQAAIDAAYNEVFERKAAGIYKAFLTNVLQSFANTPTIMPLWVCYFEFSRMPFVENVVEQIDINGSGPHVLGYQYATNVESGYFNVGETAGMGSGLALMFCQGVKTPGERFSVERDSMTNYGGFLPGFLSDSRTINEVEISMIENNASFVDFVLRPWLIANMYKGYPYSIKSNIVIEEWTKTLPPGPTGGSRLQEVLPRTSQVVNQVASIADRLNGGSEGGAAANLRLRKKITLRNAFPKSIDSESLTYQDNVETREVTFGFESYTLEGGGAWDIEPQSQQFNLGARLAQVTENAAFGLVTKQLQTLESNLVSVRNQVVNTPSQPNPSGQVSSQQVNIPTMDTPRGQDIEFQPAFRIPEDDGPIFRLVNDKVDIVIPPDGNISQSNIQDILENHIDKKPPVDDVVTTPLLRPLFTTVTPPEEDTPVYAPYALPSPFVRPPEDDVPSLASMSSQPVVIPRNEIIARSIPVQIVRPS